MFNGCTVYGTFTLFGWIQSAAMKYVKPA